MVNLAQFYLCFITLLMKIKETNTISNTITHFVSLCNYNTLRILYSQLYCDKIYFVCVTLIQIY